MSDHELIYQDLYCATRPAAGGVVAQAIGAIENALLDAKAKALGVPVYELLGGKVRDRIRVYWSHCGTWRINHPSYYSPRSPTSTGSGHRPRGAREGLLGRQDQHLPLRGRQAAGLRPGFGSPFYPELNVDTTVLRDLRMHLEALRDGAGGTSDSWSTSTSTPRPRDTCGSSAR